MNNEQLLFYNKGFNDCLAKGINPAKTLTDEEIIACIDESEPDTTDMIRFARAILRKAQEK